ncbi:cytochrome P450 2D3 isoform X2 [Amia ocellicauda]|uniref:cytochrome P450 2D3 isoform X2 n=1 Tax=Amia ocellicauda TaxID=2972642 RepID=UPI003463D507
MPYTNAVLHEIQRFANVVPMNLLHQTKSDIDFKGYRIPKGTPVIPLLTSVLFDKNHWETPHKFNPQHFLDAHGKFVKREAFMPFSAAQHACWVAKLESPSTELYKDVTQNPPTSGATMYQASKSVSRSFKLCIVHREGGK